MTRSTATALTILATAASMTVAAPAFAHTGVGSTHGFLAGLGHPLGGVDHLLAMLAVGIWAASLGGRAFWFVPASFVVAMIAGALLGHLGGAWSPVEIGIALSVVFLGTAVALRVRIVTPLAMTIVAVFGLIHGAAHSAEAQGSFVAYAAGFVLATAALHAIGLTIGSYGTSRLAPRLAGCAIAVAGLAFPA